LPGAGFQFVGQKKGRLDEARRILRVAALKIPD
jgi:hypothetical protein